MEFVAASDAKKRLLELLRETDEAFTRYCITRNGTPTAVLLSVEEYDGWLETLELLSDRQAMAEIRAARRELATGKGIPLKQLLERLA